MPPSYEIIIIIVMLISVIVIVTLISVIVIVILISVIIRNLRVNHPPPPQIPPASRHLGFAKSVLKWGEKTIFFLI